MTPSVPSAATVKLSRPTYGRSTPLPPRNHPWIRNTALVLSTAAGVTAGAPLAGIDHWSVPATTAGLVLAAGAVAVDGYYRQRRQQDTDRCAEQLCAVLGMPATRAVLSIRRWHLDNRRSLRPHRLVVRYTDAGTTLDPDCLARVGEVISGQPWGTYRLARHNHRTCRLIYVLDTTPEAAPDPEPIARAKRLVLKILGPTAVVVDSAVDETGQITMIQARHDDGARFAPSGYRDRVERTVSALLPGRWRARWNLLTDEVVFELRPAFPDTIWHDTLPDPDEPYNKAAIAFGQDEDGNKICWRPAIDPHVIFVGATGTGKTAAVHTVVTDVAARDWMVWVVDGKGSEFIGFAEWPNIQIVAARVEQQVAVIHRAFEQMEARYQAIQDGASEDDFVPLVVVIDEFADFKANLEDWYSRIRIKGDPTQPRTLLEVASLVRKGRSARVHVVLSTQRADADFFSGRGKGDTRDSLRMRVALGPLSPQGAMMMWYSPTTGITIPRGIRGRATAVNDAGDPVEIQCHYTPDPRRTPEDDPGYRVLQRLRPTTITHDRLVVLDPVEEDEAEDPDTGSRRSRRKVPTAARRRRAPISMFRRTAEAPWGWAVDHPVHDPVRRRAANLAAAGKAATSRGPLTLLGLVDAPPSRPASHTPSTKPAAPGHTVSALLAAAAAAPRRPQLRVVPSPITVADPVAPITTADEDWDGFGDPMTSGPRDVEAGDLVLIDETADLWGVVDGAPGPDLLSEDDGLIAITYRTPEDGEELLTVPDDGEVVIRRPHEFD